MTSLTTTYNAAAERAVAAARVKRREQSRKQVRAAWESAAEKVLESGALDPLITALADALDCDTDAVASALAACTAAVAERLPDTAGDPDEYTTYSRDGVVGIALAAVLRGGSDDLNIETFNTGDDIVIEHTGGGRGLFLLRSEIAVDAVAIDTPHTTLERHGDKGQTISIVYRMDAVVSGVASALAEIEG